MPKTPDPPATVPFFDLTVQYRALKADVEAAMREVCDSQQFILGPQVARFEERMAAYCGVPHAVGLSSGTDALLAAFMALGVEAGDEVIVPAYTFFATAGTVARLGARPVFCDVEPESLNLDPGAVRRWLEGSCRRDGEGAVNAVTGARVKAIVPVHLYGRTADMSALAAVGSEFGIPLVEDAAQAIGAETADGRRAGGIGAIGCLSFFPTKNLGAFGDAGMCVTGSAEAAEALRLLRVHGSGHGGRYHTAVGGNFRLDELQAAVLNVKLDHLEAWTARRREIASRYTEAFSGLGLPIEIPAVPSSGRHVFNQYVIHADARDELREHLAARRVGTAIYYPVPLHLQPCFRDPGWREGDFPVAEAAAQRGLALPVYPELTEEQQQHVIASVAEFFDRRA